MKQINLLRYVVLLNGPKSNPYRINIYDRAERKTIKHIQHDDNLTGKQIRKWYKEQSLIFNKETHYLNYPKAI